MTVNDKQMHLYHKLLKSKTGYKEINIYILLRNKTEGKVFIIELPESNLENKIKVLFQKGYEVVEIYDNIGIKFNKEQSLEDINQFISNMYTRREMDIQKILIFGKGEREYDVELGELLTFIDTSNIYNNIRSTEELGFYYGGTLGLLEDDEMAFTYKELGEIALKSGNYYTTDYGILEVNN